MNEEKKKQGESPAAITYVLRLVGGGYLVWLAFQLIPELLISSGTRNLIQLMCMTLFFLTGAILIIHSLKTLFRREKEKNGQN